LDQSKLGFLSESICI